MLVSSQENGFCSYGRETLEFKGYGIYFSPFTINRGKKKSILNSLSVQSVSPKWVGAGVSAAAGPRRVLCGPRGAAAPPREQL